MEVWKYPIPNNGAAGSIHAVAHGERCRGCHWLLAVFIFAYFHIFTIAFAGIEVSVTRGSAAENLFAGKNFDFGNGLAGWMNKHTNEVSCVEVEGRGKALFCAAGTGKSAGQVFTLFRYVKFDPGWRGRMFILACDIKPLAKVSSGALPDSASGLGCKVSFWSKEWKRSISVGCMSEGPERWQRICSRPFEFPEWAAYMGVSVGLEYSKGSGFVDDIALEEAISVIAVAVESDVPIRQVKAVGDSCRILFDSGIVDGGATWTRRILIGSCRRVKVYAVDANGKVAVAESVMEEAEKQLGE